MRARFILLVTLALMSCDLLALFTPPATPTPTSRATLAPSRTPPPAATPTPVRVTVIAFDSLYLRTGPGMQYAPNDKWLQWGDKLVFEGECRMDAVGTFWLRVSVDARSGWVSQRFVTPTVCR